MSRYANLCRNHHVPVVRDVFVPSHLPTHYYVRWGSNLPGWTNLWYGCNMSPCFDLCWLPDMLWLGNVSGRGDLFGDRVLRW